MGAGAVEAAAVPRLESEEALGSLPGWMRQLGEGEEAPPSRGWEARGTSELGGLQRLL